jgi:hypothetical protein
MYILITESTAVSICVHYNCDICLPSPGLLYAELTRASESPIALFILLESYFIFNDFLLTNDFKETFGL